MSKTEKKFKRLKYLMIRDQFLQWRGKEFALYLKERVFTSIEEMSKLEDQFARSISTSVITQPRFRRDTSAHIDKSPSQLNGMCSIIISN